jgi:hypothetical protein
LIALLREGTMTGDEIEAVARALHETLEGARGWEPEPLKRQFRQHARAAIAAIDLQHVFETKQTFIGEMMQVTFQSKPDAPLEARFVDLVYRPIEGANGETPGLLVEGSDRTRWARA